MLLYILGVLIIVVGLAVSIGLHELGHLWPAKAFGVKVSQYMIGFGPTIFSRRKGETQYGIKAIPLGGYISMEGMYPPVAPGGKGRTATTGIFETVVQEARTSSPAIALDTDDSRAFFKLPVFKRIIIMLGGPVMNLLIGIVLYAVLLCGFGIPQTTTTVASVSECVLPATSERQTCEAGDPQAPGYAAGLKPGDTIVAIDGQAIETWEQATEIIRESPGDVLNVAVQRGDDEVTLAVTPLLTERYVTDNLGQVVKDAAGVSQTQEVGFVGMGSQTATVQQPVTAVLPMVGENLARLGQLFVALPQRVVALVGSLFTSEERDPNGLIGVVGIGRIAGEIASADAAPIASRAAALVQVLASLNIALFAFNLIPLPPLDGGHVAAAIIEAIRRAFAKIRRKPDPGPIDATKIIPVTMVVASILVVLTVILVVADIIKPISIL